MGVLAGWPERSERSGGCESCDAVTVVERDPKSDGLALITVKHDEWCPELKKHTRRAGGATKAARKTAALRKALGLDLPGGNR